MDKEKISRNVSSLTSYRVRLNLKSHVIQPNFEKKSIAGLCRSEEKWRKKTQNTWSRALKFGWFWLEFPFSDEMKIFVCKLWLVSKFEKYWMVFKFELLQNFEFNQQFPRVTCVNVKYHFYSVHLEPSKWVSLFITRKWPRISATIQFRFV